MPVAGYTNVGGFDLGVPYYWNIAPNYDLTLTPHLYTERGVMLGADYRYLTQKSRGIISGTFLPQDAAFRNFLHDHEWEFPRLKHNSTNRWSLGVLESTQLAPNLNFNANVQQVSDDYYLQDFSTNLAFITQRQLLRQADLTYTTENWIFRGMAQSYQTLHPVNETPIADQYERLPQIAARGYYYDLPAHANLNIVGQYDQFFWPGTKWEGAQIGVPRGPRLHFNPVLILPQRKAWGYITPSVEFVENYYEVSNNSGPKHTDYNRFIPRYDVRGGLFFERNFNWFGSGYTQTQLVLFICALSRSKCHSYI
jgi:LPS-assembly protein